ncbi:MAG: IS66 family transposase zinc-finger binding domain-containing protein [Nostoc sp.]|uniref:IS66 family transposase zinc-finger binding domain-containing protein n=1 Tax=Nostoc sp. TaxID=1180 RepID=UPI002FF4875B
MGEDANPYRHQIVEIPPINPIIVEHRLHQLVCQQCGILTRAKLPQDVHPSGYGVRVSRWAEKFTAM